MESALLMVIEVLKNDFLCTTFGLIFIGSNMVFTGFFRKVEASPVWINWMCYVVPFKVSTPYSTSTTCIHGSPIPYHINGVYVCINVRMCK